MLMRRRRRRSPGHCLPRVRSSLARFPRVQRQHRRRLTGVPTMAAILPFPRKAPVSWSMVLVINGGAYAVEALRVAGKVIAYQLAKPDGTRYQLAADCSSCDCPAGTFRPD